MVNLIQQQDDLNSGCPSYLPKKFWDDKAGQPRIEALAQSYGDFEKKIGSMGRVNIPKHHSEYCVECKSGLFTSNPVANERMHGAGFSQEQVQLVYDLAHEALEPLVAEIAAMMHSHQQIDRLSEKFGGEERWQEVARQMRTWGETKMNPQAFEALSSSYDGIMTLYEMMTRNDEPEMGRLQGAENSLRSEGDVRKLMRDPKYWRDRDPATVERVREGFRRLYPD